MYSKVSKSVIKLILIIFLLSHAYCLSHEEQIKSLEDRQYSRLTQQQKSLEDNINSLVQDVVNVQKNVSISTNPTDKVLLLENAVLSERQKVFNMQNQLIPPFSLSKTACLQLTNQQKIQMLDRIKATKQQLTALLKQIQTAPKCDKISNLQKDTQKQLTLLQSLEKTIYTQCQSRTILTPTIYQSNIYADGWILGDQHIDDLIEEYYQRNIRYHNITNCPLDKPFFDGYACIICKDPNPVFNILTKQCTVCPKDQQPDPNIRQCALVPHYTNFSTVTNWAQQGASMPIPKKDMTPCPPNRPYYTGLTCSVCLLPKYWSIKANACLQCPKGTVFDQNTQKCETPEANDLTILQGTRWVTNDCNITRIIKQRVEVLNTNKTKKIYKMCPPEKPFYDGIVCVSCPNQFNIDTKKCASNPNATTIYDQNMKCYLKKQTNFETDPKASNYVSNSPLLDSSTPNCQPPRSFYDGNACIACLSPFPVFNVEKKRCTACDPMQIYNNTKHSCIPRQKIYISTNEQKILVTKKMSIDDYHSQIKRKITDNPDALIILCQGSEYSDYKQCFNCSSLEYFNIESKKCQLCDGTVNPKTKLCVQKQYLYTNINPSSTQRIVGIPLNTTLLKQNQTIKDNLKIHSNASLCPLTAPYYNNKQCTNCTKQSFNFTSSLCEAIQCLDPKYPFYNSKTDKCQQCPKNMKYEQNAKKCEPVVYVTNTDAIFYYIEQGNATKANLEDQIFTLESNNSVITCDASHPYYNGTDCIDCSISRNASQAKFFKPYFNLKSLKCQACTKYDNVTHKCLDSTAPKNCTFPLPVLDKVKNECVACPKDTFWIKVSNKCDKCSNGTSYNEKTQACQGCAKGTFWIKASNKCDVCSNGMLYNEKSQSCQACAAGSFWIKSSNKCDVCPTGTTYNSKSQSCQACAAGQIYNSVTKKCETWVTNVPAMNDNYIEEGDQTKTALNKTAQQLKKSKNALVCPADSPFFSKVYMKCAKCVDPAPYFNLASELCQSCDNYNKNTHICEQSLPRFKMNVQDFYGTIFG